MNDSNNKNIESVKLKPNIGAKNKITCIIILFLFALNINIVNAIDNNSINKNVQHDTSVMFEKNKQMNFKHKKHIALLLPNGKVLIRNMRTAEIYNPKTKEFKKLPKQQLIAHAYGIKEAKVMNDGKTLILQRRSDAAYSDFRMELFDYQTETFEKFHPKLPYDISTTSKHITAYILSSDFILFKFNNEYFIYNYKENNYREVEWDIKKLGSKIYIAENGIILSPLAYSHYNIIKYNQNNNSFEIVGEIEIEAPYNKKILITDEKIYFLTGIVRVDKSNLREGEHISPIYEYDFKTKELKKGFLSNGSAVSSVVLADGRILINSGKFNGEYVRFEIYDPNTKTSSFTPSYAWYRESTMTLLEDGSVLYSGGWIHAKDSTLGTTHAIRIYPDYDNSSRKHYTFNQKRQKEKFPSINEISKEFN